LLGIAFAMGQTGGEAAPQTSAFGAFVPLLLVIGIMYFLMIRPQQKKAKEHREMLQNLKKGDRVITGGGIHGRVTGMDDTTLTVEIADKVRVKVNRGNIQGVVQPKAPAPQK
jgi:preprotein translocase subunit YajC